MEFRVLGPVEFWVEGRRHGVGGRKEECILAALLLSAGRTVSADRLLECTWGSEPPPTGRETLQVYVSRIRKRLRDTGAHAMVSSSAAARGYRIDVPPGSIDIHRFDELIKQAAVAAAESPERAVRLLADATELFAGEPLAGLTGEWALTTRASLLEQRRAAVLRRIEIELRLGRHDTLIGELTELAAHEPLDQTAVGLLMTALYHAGRPAEALAAYRDARSRLNRNLGFEPRRELRELHQRIIQGEATLWAPTPVRPVAAPQVGDTIDSAPRRFVGREREISILFGQVEADLKAATAPSVQTIEGMPGIGKTTFVVYAAHRLSPRFPDARLQLRLRGHDPRQPPMEPSEALVALLGMVGVQTPELTRLRSEEALSAVWRSRTARMRLLLLLDDARDVTQVEPLIPASPGSLVLITSRSRVSGLENAHSLVLEAMPPADASALFREHAGVGQADKIDQVQEIARLCAGLPLAVVVAAGHLKSRPAWDAGDLAARMAYARARPDAADQFELPVNAAFALSYQALTQDQQRLFRNLGLHQSPEFSLHAAAALNDMTAADTDRALDVLVGHNLLDEPVRHRYRMHDLLRDYAAQRAFSEDDEATRKLAVRRLFDYYLFAADQAGRTIQPQHRRGSATVDFVPRDLPPVSTVPTAQAWLTAEQDNLLTAIRFCAANGLRMHAAQLPHVLAQHIDSQGQWKQAVEAHEAALGAYYALGNRPGQATALTDLAAAHWRVGDLETAQVCADAALDIWREVGDQAGESDALFELGRVHWHARRPVEAEHCFRDAALLRARVNDQRGLAVATYHRGIIEFELGGHAKAISRGSEALAIARAIRDPMTERDCLTNLGEMHQRLGRNAAALQHFRQALDLTRIYGSPQRSAVLANNVGVVYSRTGDHHAALKSFHEALETHRQIGDQRNEFDTVLNIADVNCELGRFDEAFGGLRRAVDLAEQMGDPLLYARVRHALGSVHEHRGQLEDALLSYRTALAYARKAAAPLERARAHERIGDLLASSDQPSKARIQWRRALALFEELQVSEAERVRQRLQSLNGEG